MIITLAKALKYRNRVVARIARVSEDIKTWNSIVEGAEREVNIQELLAERAKLVKNLLELKVCIVRANEHIQRDIFLLSEIKSEIDWLRGTSTTHGKTVQRDRWDDTPAENYEAQLRKSDIDKMIVDREKQIDITQDGIDAHNHVTTIDIDVLL